MKKMIFSLLIHLVHMTATLYQVGAADESRAGFCPLYKILSASLENQLRKQTQEFIFSVLRSCFC